MKEAIELVGKKTVEWLVTNNILRLVDYNTYGLVDEFLRIRLALDESTEEEESTEIRFISLGKGVEEHLSYEDDFTSEFDEHIFLKEDDNKDSSTKEDTEEEDD
jgi:hypothetical protein